MHHKKNLIQYQKVVNKNSKHFFFYCSESDSNNNIFGRFGVDFPILI